MPLLLGGRACVALLAAGVLSAPAVEAKGKHPPPAPPPPCAYKANCAYPHTHWSGRVTTPISSKEECCCACKLKKGTHKQQCEASVFYAGPPAECWLHTFEDVARGCVANSSATACLNRDPGWGPPPPGFQPGPPAPPCGPAPCSAQQNQTACGARHCTWAKGKCASPPPPPKPPPAPPAPPPAPAVLPCTIAPLPPTPAPKRWASYWGSAPDFLNGTNADYVTRYIKLL
eukprot:COSAG02_NODE_19458_length_880_cov_16.793854_1_plen_229_part_10